MKTYRTILATLLVSLSVSSMWSSPLGNVLTDNHRIHLYDMDGNMFKSISDINGEVVGFSSDFFITQKSGWIYLYNNEGKMYKTMSARMVGEVVNVNGDTFTTKKGNLTSVYSMTGKLVYSIEKGENSNKIRI